MSVSPSATRNVPWLSADEQRAWRGWITAGLQLSHELERSLKAEHGITLADYEILVRLSEAPDWQMRMSDLAAVTLSSRSRLSHQVARMEAHHWLSRHGCPTDRRGTFAQMTPAGWSLLNAAAPSHVASVRRYLVDALTPEEFLTLGSTCEKISAHITSDESLSLA